MKKIKVVELFAGVGGFRLGLEKSSNLFNTIWANQWEPNKQKQHAFDNYIYNFGNNKNHVNEDIAIAKFNMPNEIDLLVGGFPCQDYSVARTQAEGIKGKKGVLWWEISWIIKEKQPNMILLENVDRLLKSTKNQKGRDFGIMLYDLYNNGYFVEWRVINAAEYGLQQKRRRVFIFAYKKELNLFNIQESNLETALKIIQEKGFFAKSFKIIQELTLNNLREIDIKEKFSDLADISDNFKFDFENSGIMINSKIFTAKVLPKNNKESIKLKNLIHNKKVDDKYFLNTNQELKIKLLKDKKRIERFKPTGERYYYSEGQMPIPDNFNYPARTMLTSEGTVNRSSHIIKDKINEKLRFITPIEAERINGFPDNWTNSGMPERFRYFCMGNALVVDLIEIMGNSIKELWIQKYKIKTNKKISVVNTINCN